MSDQLQPNNPNYMNKRSQIIICGYVRNGLQLISSTAPETASQFIYLILLFVDDYFNQSRYGYHGYYQWNINNQLLERMMTSKKNALFISKEFKIGEIGWKLTAYPQNQINSSLLQIALKAIDIPSKWNKVIISANLYCLETLSGDTSIFTFHSNESQIPQRWRDGVLSLKYIKNTNIKQLTLCIDMEIIEIISSINNNILYEYKWNIPLLSIREQQFKWNINNEYLERMKAAYFKECFISNIFNNMFCLRIYPNGYIKKGDVYIELQWMGIPKILNDILINWRIYCIDNDIKTENINKFNYNLSFNDWGNDILSFEEFKLYHTFTICVDINIAHLFNSSQQKQITSTQHGIAPGLNEMDVIPPKPYEISMELESIPVSMNRNESIISQNEGKENKSELNEDNDLKIDVLVDTVNKLDDRFKTMTKNVASMLNGLEQKRINDINTIHQQYNNKITHLYQQITQQIQLLTNKLVQNETNNQQNLGQLQQELAVLYQHQNNKENEFIKLQKEINCLKDKNGDNDNYDNNDDIDNNDDEKKEISEMEKIKIWLTEKVKLSEYFPNFIENGYDDFDVIVDINSDDLKHIGIDKMGHRKKLIKYIEKLKNNNNNKEASSSNIASIHSISPQPLHININNDQQQKQNIINNISTAKIEREEKQQIIIPSQESINNANTNITIKQQQQKPRRPPMAIQNKSKQENIGNSQQNRLNIKQTTNIINIQQQQRLNPPSIGIYDISQQQNNNNTLNIKEIDNKQNIIIQQQQKPEKQQERPCKPPMKNVSNPQRFQVIEERNNNISKDNDNDNDKNKEIEKEENWWRRGGNVASYGNKAKQRGPPPPKQSKRKINFGNKRRRKRNNNDQND